MLYIQSLVYKVKSRLCYTAYIYVLVYDINLGFGKRYKSRFWYTIMRRFVLDKSPNLSRKLADSFQTTRRIILDNLPNRSRQLAESFQKTCRFVLDNSPNHSRQFFESFQTTRRIVLDNSPNHFSIPYYSMFWLCDINIGIGIQYKSRFWYTV